MKKICLIIVCVIFSYASTAQTSHRINYYNTRTGRLEKAYKGNSDVNGHTGFDASRLYYGLRLGLASTHFSTQQNQLKGIGSDLGINIGATIGYQPTAEAPVFIESGLYFIRKGAKDNAATGKFTYSLNYLEIPIVVKYAFCPDKHISIEPMLGFYFAEAISGRIKDYATKTSYTAFSDYKIGDNQSNFHFRHPDAGIRLGCGVGYDVAYLEVVYDIGLANVGTDDFASVRNHALMINLGVNF